MKPISLPLKPFDVISMDFIIDLPVSEGYDAVLVAVDKLTKFGFFVPCHGNIDSKGTAELFFKHVVCFAGLPYQIITDRDSRWAFSFWKEVCEQMKTKRSLTTAYHPQADGQTEVLNQYLEIAVRAYINDSKSNWSRILPHLQFSYNTTPHTATRYSPAYLVFGYEPNRPITYLTGPDNETIARPEVPRYENAESKEFVEEFEGHRAAARDALRLAQVEYEKQYNADHINVEFNEGDFVLINPHSLRMPDFITGLGTKFNARYDGPFEIQEKVSPVAYRLKLPHSYGIHNVISIAHLEPYQVRDGAVEVEGLPKPSRPGFVELQEYEVEEIVAQKWKSGKNGRKMPLYYCRWKGFGITDEVVTAQGMRNSPEVLAEWNNKVSNDPDLLNYIVIGSSLVRKPQSDTGSRRLGKRSAYEAPLRRNPPRKAVLSNN